MDFLSFFLLLLSSLERAWVHKGNSLTCRNEEPKLSPSACDSSSSPWWGQSLSWGQAPRQCQPGRTCVHRSSGMLPPSRSSAGKAQSPGEPSWAPGGVFFFFVSTHRKVGFSRVKALGLGFQARLGDQAGSSPGRADCDRVLSACARPGTVAELGPGASQHLPSSLGGCNNLTPSPALDLPTP